MSGRFFRSIVVGAMATTAAPAGVVLADCPSDLDGDCMVGGSDMGLFFMAWGTDVPEADFDGDGVVGGGDFGLLLQRWGACDGCSLPEHVHGNPEILTELHDGNASVLMIGDSISNWGGTNFSTLFHAAICTWKPVEWRGIHTSPESSGSVQGHYVLSGESSGPGDQPAFMGIATDLTGEFTAVAEAFVRFSGSSSGSRIFAGVIDHRLFEPSPAQRPPLYRMGRPFENAAGEVDFIDAPGRMEAGFTFLVNGDVTAEGLRYLRDLRGRVSRGSVVEMATSEVTLDVTDEPALSSLRFEWQSAGMRNSSPGLLTQLEMFPSAPASNFEVAVVQDFYLGRPDRPNGLSLSYLGDGGWRVGSHVHPLGSEEAPPVDDRRPGYSDRALIQRIDSIAATHYFIHIGANDFSCRPPMRVDDYMAELGNLIDRLRAAHAGAGRQDPRFVFLGLYPTAFDDETIIRPRKDRVRRAMVALTRGEEDMVYLDLAGHLETIFDLSNLDVANPFADAWLIDGIHPNLIGAEAIGSWIWSRVVAAREGGG